jgi:hypothetical protein
LIKCRIRSNESETSENTKMVEFFLNLYRENKGFFNKEISSSGTAKI